MTHDEFMKSHEERMSELNEAIVSLDKVMNFECTTKQFERDDNSNHDEVMNLFGKIDTELEQLLK